MYIDGLLSTECTTINCKSRKEAGLVKHTYIAMYIIQDNWCICKAFVLCPHI